MAGPLKAHNWHDTFSGTEPNPPGPAVQPFGPKNINPGDPKVGPRKASTKHNDSYSE